MILNGKRIESPIISKISFFKVFEFLEEMLVEEDQHRVSIAKDLLKDLKPFPILKDGFEDVSILIEHKDLINRMMILLFPPALTFNDIKSACPPYRFKPFYSSKRYADLIEAAGNGFELIIPGVSADNMYIMACITVLQAYYKYPGNSGMPFVIPIPEENGIDIRYYRSSLNAELIQIVQTKKAIEITENDYWELMENLDNISLWKEKFPTKSWEIKGISIIDYLDITVDQSISMMTSNLLEGSTDAFDKVIDNVRSLLRLHKLKISFFALENGLFLAEKKYQNEAILLNDLEKLNCETGFCNEAKYRIFSKGESFIISDVEIYSNKEKNLLTKQLQKSKVKSYILTPLIYDDELIGCIEIGSRKKNELNRLVHERLKLVLPIMSMAAARYRQEGLNRIEAIIQKECTTIHPTVKWKFVKSAKAYIEAEDRGEIHTIKDINFPDVYPIYGQIDIKGSSVIRNQAVRNDMSIQLGEIKKIIIKAIEIEPLSTYKEMFYRIEYFIKRFETDDIEGNDQMVLSYLKSDIYPYFKHFKKIDRGLKKEIEMYLALLTKKGQNMVYIQRKAYDETVAQINMTLADYIDARQVEAQKIFPHYFDRNTTDGLDYNIYIGQSLVENKVFNRIYLNNLQLWQLQIMCEMELLIHQIQGNLPTFLEVASLILVFNTSISIQFRMDEKHFDVDGASNARYEIIKKRIDKAHVKGTSDRVTVPNKIAIIYYNKEDANSYRSHISYLASQGYLKEDSLEDLEIEDLQGVSGLKALRIEVDYTKT